jgi:hypothetical protein
MKRWRFDMRTAYESGATEHPQTVIKRTFPDAHNWEPVTIGDCWLFESAMVPESIPGYFTEIE